MVRLWTMLLISGAVACCAAWAAFVLRENGFSPFHGVRRTFRGRSKYGKAVLGSVFFGLFVLCATKPQTGGNGGDLGGEGGGTDVVQMAVNPPSGLQPTIAPEAMANGLRQSLQDTIQPPPGGMAGDPSPVADEWGGFAPITSTNTERTLDADDFRRGFVMTRTGIGETFDFSAPAGATVCAGWLAFGAAEDWTHLAFEDWAFRLGTNEVERLRVFSFGKVDPLPPATDRWFAPFRATLGIVPQANWPLVAGNENAAPEDLAPSRFWHFVTPSNTLVMTWQNVLFGRDTDTPVSVQMELCPNGRFAYRYDLSRCGGRGATALPGGEVTDILVGASLGSLALTTNSMPTNVTSLAFHPLAAEDAVNADRDGDGLSLLDELFVHGTDPELRDTDFDGVSDGDEVAAGINPHTRDFDGDGLVDGSDPDPAVQTSLADLDGDGIPDAYENFWFGGTNMFNTATNRDETGFTLDGKILGGINSTNGAAAATVASTNGLVSWKLFDGFAADWAASATNLVWERTFTVDRTSAWQQFFVSASPTDAAGWRLDGMALEWETDAGSHGSAAASPFGDSFRIPLATNDLPYTLTLRLRAAGAAAVRSPSPLYLIAYAPELRIGGGDEITGLSGAKFHVFLDGSDSSIDLTVDRSLRPCHAPPVADECDMAELEGLEEATGYFAFSGDASGGTIAARRPGMLTLPDLSLHVSAATPPLRSPRRPARRGGGGSIVVLDPSAHWGCRSLGCLEPDGLSYGWDEDLYVEEDTYPLDTSCLRAGWAHGWDGRWLGIESCTLHVTAGVGDTGGLVETDDNGSVGQVLVDGVAVWSGSAEHVHDDSCIGYQEGGLGDDGCGCDSGCANGSCDSLEGASLGSLKFRIPLGAPVKGHVAGFVWFATEEPMYISKSAFQLLEHPDATVTDTTSSGTRRIVCSDSRGRDLRIEDIADGLRITICEAAAQTLEHAWEIVNVNGDPSCIRLRKISRLNNVMSDETFAYADGDWTRFDNIAGVGTRLTAYDDFAEPGGGVKWETRTTTDANGCVLSSVTTEQTRIGECDNAVLRETYRAESTGRGWKASRADYWNDPSHSLRHGRPRLVWGDARAWVYTDFDENGHETLRVEQRGDATIPEDFPYVISNELHNAAALSDAFVTVRDLTPLPGDSCSSNDVAKPRTETRYVVKGGVPTLIGRTWTRYTRLVRDGYDAIRKETWRDATGATDAPPVGDDASGTTGVPPVAYSYEITYAGTGDGTPLLMRNAAAETLDEDGILTVNTYSLSGGVLSCETRRYGPSHLSPSSQMTQFLSCETTERDASYGTVLRRTVRLASDDTIIEDEQSVYDGKNRLRSTTYLDGTSLTNAYSCCRLLWKRDREGRKVLRSAQTGTDHLYNAMEDVWLSDISTNGQYRVTQRFYDALGRETNTVVYVGATPGEATAAAASDGKACTTVTTSYPYGGSDYAVSTDERGRVTVLSTDILDGCIETVETVSTNGVEVMKTTRRTHLGGGTTVRREWPAGRADHSAPQVAWTEERRFTDYAADGRRVEYVVTDSSDCGVVTNSVSTYDQIGRLVSTAVPGANGSTVVTSNDYDGTTTRILTSTRYAPTLAPRTITYLYNLWGGQVGTVLDGVTNRTDTTYETDASNIAWRVETSSVIGPSTNSLTITRTQLTGLSDACRRHTVTLVGRDAPIAPQTVTETTASFDPATGIETETVTSSIAPTIIRRRLHGILLSTETDGETTENAYDAFGRVAGTSRTIGEAALSPFQTFTCSPCGDLIAKHTYTNGTDIITETYAYDLLGNRIATTDALGNTTFKSYDPLGNVIAEDGATYPVRYTYDSQSRRTSLSTTRDGTTWDTTTWTYDPYTSLCTSKTYADGSMVSYSYTPDNLPLRTTYASGRWKENVYDEWRKVVAVEYSDGETDSFAYDAFANEIAASNGVASAWLDRDAKGNCTNETAVVGDESRTTRRTFDAFSRLTEIDGTIYDYNADGLLVSISNGIALVEYAYTPDRMDAGYSLTLSNGVVFARSTLRDGYRRSLVTGISSVANGVGVGSLEYAYDALSRPISRNADTFGYNARSEVTMANVSGDLSAYGYDEIGNSTNWAANCLNQYTQFICDLDGNMIQCRDWTYTYDAANRLKTVSSNGVILATNFYDAKSRRVKKVAPEATTTFFYDGWNLIEERIAYTNGASSTIRYYWGKDLSGTLQGAGGVGGLLYLTVDGVPYIPCYDNIGNITRYLDANGNTVAQYTYNAFGGKLSQSGILADTFHFRFSTKYCNRESGLYYYGYRFYSPSLMRWLNRDPIEEEGGVNVYSFCKNNGIVNYDTDGRAFFAVRRLKIGSFNVPMGNVYAQGGGFLDRHNIQILHEQLFFQDDNQPISVGFGSKDVTGESFDGYVATLGGYNDCVMRKATEQIKFSGHNYAAFWFMGHIRKCNCQDYCSALRSKYNELIKDKNVRCECGLK